MTSQPQPYRAAFGPFEVDAAAGELRKSGLRIRLAGQPFQILLVLLAHPGEVVSRDQLTKQIWSEGTFVDFEHGLSAAVNKLRRALGDSAENPRYIETVPGFGYRFIGSITVDLAETVGVPAGVDLVVERPAIVGPTAEKGQHKLYTDRWWLLAATLALAAIALTAASWIHATQASALPSRLTRLTDGAGVARSPALSRDGTLMAYSSDRAAEGQWDLYVKHITGGQPIRLTSDGAGNETPDFSPDGSKIVFRSNRDGGGIYVTPALGGEIRLVARDGLDPKFSPDGSQVAYWIGAPNVADKVPGSGTVWVAPAAGGQLRRVGSNFTAARYPIWSPDGKHLLFVGYTSAKAWDNSSVDWWLVATDGGTALRTGAYEALVQAGLQARDPASNPVSRPALDAPRPGCWSGADAMVVSLANGDSRNLWEMGISPLTGKVSGAIKRLTTGAGNEVDPSCASGGLLAFTNLESRRDVWALPFDLDSGTSKGALERVTQGSARREGPSLSDDGRFLAFASDQGGRTNIWVREFGSGKESIVAGSSLIQRFPVSNASGARIAFSAYENDARAVYVSAPGGVPEKVCEGCLRATDWSRDEKTLLVFGGSPYQIDALDVATHRQTALLQHPSYNLLYGRFSPDNRWVSFTIRTQPNRARIAIAPLDGQKPVPESAWITIAEAGIEDFGNWSPDGKTLYFTSDIDGHRCVWGRRIEASSGRPVGEAFAALHLHGRASLTHEVWSAAGGRIGVTLAEDTGNIWTMSRSGAP